MISREDLELVVQGFGDEMVGRDESDAYDRVREELWADESVHGWVPVRTIDGEVAGERESLTTEVVGDAEGHEG